MVLFRHVIRLTLYVAGGDLRNRPIGVNVGLPHVVEFLGGPIECWNALVLNKFLYTRGTKVSNGAQ